ncbi:MAG: aspartate aminotransferase family protein [Chthoniobacterales bacterium]
MTTRERYQKYVMPTYGRFDLTVERGSGCYVWDDKGRQYLDFGAGIAVCSLGHAHPAITKAITEQAQKLVHASNLYYTEPQGLLAEQLVKRAGAGKIFFCNSGAEANEGLFKLARKFGNPTGRFEIITAKNSFHGRTLAGIAATGQDKVKKGFEPAVEGFIHAEFNDLASVEKAITPKTAAILVEPIQGESGIHITKAAFLQGLRQLCDKHDLLLLMDEIQCGLGRTGDWCGWKSVAGETAQPDGVSWAKGIANGFPLGAFWARDKKLSDGSSLSDLLGPGTHGTTYGGNPVACAAGLAVLETIEKENLLQNTLEMGAYLREEIREIHSPLIKEVRAIGLMIGVELNADLRTRFGIGPGEAKTGAVALVQALIEEGLIVVPAGESTIRLLPPLNVGREAANEAVSILRATLEKLAA